MFQELLNHMINIANMATMASVYEWSDVFARAQTKKTVREPTNQYTIRQIKSMTNDELRMLGFAKWDDVSGLWLVPLWAYYSIKDGETLICIDGESCTKGTDKIDLDIRFGCIAYGFVLDSPVE